MKTVWVSIDPGKNDAGIAIWDKKNLDLAFYIRGPRLDCAIKDKLRNRKISHIFGEKPKVYPIGRSKGKPEHLIDVSISLGVMVGSIIQINTKVIYFEPWQWKGQVPKQVMIDRIKKELPTKSHINVLGPPSKIHNTWDAVGVGLYAMKAGYYE